MPRLDEIRVNLIDRLQEAKEQGWLGEVAAIEASLAAAELKLTTMRDMSALRDRAPWDARRPHQCRPTPHELRQ